jgi:hypothetical protein
LNSLGGNGLGFEAIRETLWVSGANHTNLHAIECGVERRGTDAFARLKPAAHDDAIPLRSEQFDLTEANAAFWIDDVDLVAGPQRIPRQDEGLIELLPLDRGVYEESDREGSGSLGFESEGIGDAGDEMDHPAARVELGLCADELAFPLMGGACEIGFEVNASTVRRRSTFAFHAARSEGDDVEKGELTIRQGESNLGIIDCVDAGDGRAASDELTDINLFASHSATIGRTDRGSIQIALRAFETRFGLTQACFGDFEFVFGIVYA